MERTEYRFLEPLDVLFLRGNKLFGDPGSFGESLVPPWPSVAAGALRSLMLANEGVDLAAFAAGDLQHPAFGTPRNPGPFSVTGFDLAGRDAHGDVVVFRPAPSDLLVLEDESGALSVQRLQPRALAGALACSAPLGLLPVLAQTARSKSVGGYWLGSHAWSKYLAGAALSSDDLVHRSRLWQLDSRVGVGLDMHSRSAGDGKLFTSQAVAMHKRSSHPDGFDVGFLVACSGAQLPAAGMVRLGGDGRAAALSAASPAVPNIDLEGIVRARRCRLVLTTPGIFPEGWRLPGMEASNVLQLDGVRARVSCAAVARAEVVSGWDLARERPKSARRAAPTGSVYWLEDLEATPEALRTLMHGGLWTPQWLDAQRRVEGFNRFTLAVY